jgi:hypothetical protein
MPFFHGRLAARFGRRGSGLGAADAAGVQQEGAHLALVALEILS